jgi:hypothetical protein
MSENIYYDMGEQAHAMDAAMCISLDFVHHRCGPSDVIRWME